MNKRQIPDCSIYAVVDRDSLSGASVFRVVKECLRSGVEIIQYRNKSQSAQNFYKDALLIRKIIGDKALFIINDRADIARLVGADGLHIGQDDLPIDVCRRIIGRGKVIGKSCHNLKEAILAETEGADYISIGPIFQTPTKPDYPPVGLKLLKKVCCQIRIPVVAIGGICRDNASLLRGSGAKAIAAVRAVCKKKNIVRGVFELRSRAF